MPQCTPTQHKEIFFKKSLFLSARANFQSSVSFFLSQFPILHVKSKIEHKEIN
jgi:hypothetical protein